MTRFNSLTENKQRDAQVTLETAKPPSGHHQVGPDGEEDRLERLIETTERTTLEAPAKKTSRKEA